MNKIALFIMTEKGLNVFKRVVEINKRIIDFVVVGTDTNVENDFSKEIINLANLENIVWFNKGNEPSVITNVYIFAISWRWMINHPSDKLIVFHDSLLPRYRGFSPLVNMLINGEPRIGVSAILGTREYDTGVVIAQHSSTITYPITISEAIKLNNRNYIKLADKIISKIARGEKLVGSPQDEREATYSIWRDSDDYLIDWNKSANEIQRLVDALGSPFLGARTKTSQGEELKILKVEVLPDIKCELRHVGKVIFLNNGLPTVICGKGLLRIIEAYSLVSAREKPYLPMKSFKVKFV